MLAERRRSAAQRMAIEPERPRQPLHQRRRRALADGHQRIGRHRRVLVLPLHRGQEALDVGKRLGQRVVQLAVWRRVLARRRVAAAQGVARLQLVLDRVDQRHREARLGAARAHFAPLAARAPPGAARRRPFGRLAAPKLAAAARRRLGVVAALGAQDEPLEAARRRRHQRRQLGHDVGVELVPVVVGVEQRHRAIAQHHRHQHRRQRWLARQRRQGRGAHRVIADTPEIGRPSHRGGPER